MADNMIELVASLNVNDSAKQINKVDIPKLQKKIEGIKIKCELDTEGIASIQSQLANIKINAPQIDLGVGSGSELINNVSHIVDNVEDKIEELRKNLAEKFRVSVDEIVTNTVKNAKGQINSFSFDLTKLSGEVEKFSYEVNRTKDKDSGSGKDYTVTSVKAIGSRDSDKGAIQLLERATKAANTLERQMINLKAAADDVSAPRPITSQESIDKVAQAYKNAETAVGNLRTANASTFEDLNNEAKKAVDELNNVIKAQRNADTAATKLRAKPIEVVKADELSNLDKFVATISNSAIPDVANLTQRVEELRSELSEVNDKQGLVDYLNKFANVESDFKALVAQAKAVKGALRDLDNLSNNALFQKNTTNPEIASTLSDIEAIRKEYSQLFAEIGDAKTPEDLQKISNRLTELKPQFDKVTNSANQFKAALKLENIDAGRANRIKSLSADMDRYAEANKRAVESTKKMSNGKTFADEWARLTSEMAKGAELTDQELKNLIVDFRVFGKEAETVGLKGESAFGKFLNSFKTMSSYITANMVFNAAKRQLSQMIEEVKAVDTAMVELRKVTSATEYEFQEFAKSATKTGIELGASVSDVINATATFARLGESLPDAEELGRVATLYKNVGDGIDIETASEDLISTMKAFKIEAKDAIKLVDKFNEVGNSFAISSGGIGEALKRSASALASANNDVSQSIALITTANTIAQDPASVGQGIKTMSLRIRSTKTELEDLGEDAEGAAENVSKLREQMLALTGVDIQLNKNTYKSTYQILLEMSKVWDKLDDMTQASVLEQLFGKRQANIGAAILSNGELLQQVYETSEKASDGIGSAMREQEEYAKSIQYNLDSLKASYQQLAQEIVQSETVVTIIKALNEGLQSLGSSDIVVGINAVSQSLITLTKTALDAKEKIESLPAIGGLAEMGLDRVRGVSFLKAAGKIYDLFNKNKKAAEEAARKQEELNVNYEKSVEVYDETAKGLQNLTSEYIKLMASSEDVSSVRESLLNLQNNFVDKYGEEAGGIDLVNKSLEENVRLLLERQKTLDENFAKENAEAIEQAKKRFGVENISDKSKYTQYDLSMAAALKDVGFDDEAKREAKLYIKEVSEYLKKNYADIFQNNITETLYGFDINAGITPQEQQKTANAIAEAYKNAFEKYKNLKNQVLNTDDISKAIEEWQGEIIKGVDILQKEADATKDINFINAFMGNKEDSDRFSKLLLELDKFNNILNSDESTLAEKVSASNDLNKVIIDLNELAEKYPAVSELIKQKTEAVGLTFDHVTDTFETAKSAWLKTLDEAQKGVLTNVDKITVAMKKLYKGEAIDSKSAWDILNIDDGKLLSDVRIDANSNYTFDMQQLIALKDKLIEKEIANQEEIINTAKVNKAAAEADIELAKKQLEVKRMELAAAKAPNSMATNVAELDNEVNRLESGVSATQDAIDSYDYAIRNASLYSEELRKKLGDLSNNSEVLQAKIDGLKKSLEQLKEELSALNKEADARLKAQEHVLDDIIDGHKKELETLEKEKEALEEQLEVLEKQKSETEEIIDNYKTVADVVTSAIEKEIKSIEDERDSIEEYYDEQINRLKKANDEREDAIEYEQKLANLANAQNNKVRVYDQERGWTYETNKEELKKAQDDLKSFETNQRIKDMEKQKETATQGYDERIKALQDYADQWTEAVNSVTDAENELLAQEILGSDWREKITKQDLITLNKFKTGFTNYNTKLKNLVDTEIASMNKSIEAKDKDVKAKQEQVKAWEEYRTKVEETAQTIKDGLEEYNNYLSDVGVNEKSTNEERQKNLENFATKYKELIDEITKKNSTIEETEKTITGLTEAMNDLNKASSNLTGVNVATNTGSLLGGISGAGVAANIGTIINNILEKLHGLENNLFKSIFHYANGGAADYTGLAWVDGTKTASETVFTAAQSKKLLSYVEALPNLGFKMFNGAGLKNNSTSNTQNVTFNGGITVVANNPEQFSDQMNRYIRTKLTQSKVN